MGLPDPLDGRDRGGRRPHVRPGDDPLDQCRVLAEILFAVRYIAGLAGDPALPLDEQKRRLRDPEVRRRLVAEEARMKPRDSDLQGGGAATTDPSKPDYANLYPMLGVDWDDPSVADLARQQRQASGRNHDRPVPGKRQPRLRAAAGQRVAGRVLGMLKHPRTLATFSNSGAHVCQEMGSSLQTHLLSYWVRKRQPFTLEEAVRMLTFDNASAWELPDRGLVRTGYAADLVVFDEAAHPAAPADRRAGSAGRRPAPRAEGGRHRRHDRQRRRRRRARRADRRICRTGAEGPAGGGLISDLPASTRLSEVSLVERRTCEPSTSHEAKTHLSRLVDRAAKGEPFIIAKAGKPLVKVVPLDAPIGRKTRHLDFLAGQIKVPDDFDTMFAEEIEKISTGNE